MAYTALQLITRSYYLSQVVSRELQSVSGDQITDGLDLLNALLDFKGSDLRLIPYFSRTTFNAVQGQEKYFIANLLYIDALTFNIGPVRYSMRELSRKDYFETPRVDNIQALPFTYRSERTLGGMNIYLYFLPESNYVMNLSGKYGFTDVTLQTDLSLIYDTYYIEYLRYSLAEYICGEYGATFPDRNQLKLAELEKKVMDVSPPDLTIRKMSYFGSGIGMDWQHANISPGYYP